MGCVNLQGTYIRVTNENVTILDRKRPLFLSETTS